MGTFGGKSTAMSTITDLARDGDVEERDVHGLRLQKQNKSLPNHKIIPPLARCALPSPNLNAKTKGSRPPSRI